ncbi:MAG: M48 family metallopeptidase [Porphyromonadaceae bacterium]|nr:M48 family metallopeptidase [Porphyromonadaceae bacterium]
MVELFDKELGKIIVVPHKGAKRVIARQKNGYLQLTVPYRFGPKQFASVLEELRPRLSGLKPLSRPAFGEEDMVSTFTFNAQVVRDGFIHKPVLSLKHGELHIYMPQRSDLSLPENQQFIKEAITRVLRIEAKRTLPEKTASFARQHNLLYRGIKINSSKGRWGSCSAQKNINFSLFLMLLPERLIDYVVLHELAHTVEMNHGEKFWSLLDRFCQGRARELSREVKKFRPEWYEFLIQG